MKTAIILGESPLVEEYAHLCQANGIQVAARVNGGGELPQDVSLLTGAPGKIEVAFELTNSSVESKRRNLEELEKQIAPGVCILTSSVVTPVGRQTAWVRHPGRIVGIGAFPSLLEGGLVELAKSPATNPESREYAKALLGQLGKEVSFVADSVGMVLPRILCMLANEAYFALMEEVASAGEIDTAMRLGTNYPRGPVEWAERIGLRQIHAVLTSLHATLAEDRYRVAPLLERLAMQQHKSL